MARASQLAQRCKQLENDTGALQSNLSVASSTLEGVASNMQLPEDNATLKGMNAMLIRQLGDVRTELAENQNELLKTIADIESLQFRADLGETMLNETQETLQNLRDFAYGKLLVRGKTLRRVLYDSPGVTKELTNGG